MKFFISIYRFIIRFLALRTLGGYKTKPFIGFYSRFTKNTFLGKNCNFNGMMIRGFGKVTIGNNFHSGKNCLFINTYHKYNNGNAIPYDTNEVISKDIIIEDNVWIGDKVIILGGVKIEEGVIIQAGSVVVSSIEKYAIAGGNPAQVFKYRDIDSYEKLKKMDKYSNSYMK